MKNGSTLFLRTVICLIAVGSFAALIWEPQTEGRNVHADLASIYFHDPFLAYLYIAFIPFFVALYQAFKLLGHIDRNKIFSQTSVKAVGIIKYCATAIAVFILAAVAYLSIVIRGKDDIAGGVAIGSVIIFASVVTATTAHVFQKILQSATDIKTENNLTVC